MQFFFWKFWQKLKLAPPGGWTPCPTGIPGYTHVRRIQRGARDALGPISFISFKKSCQIAGFLSQTQGLVHPVWKILNPPLICPKTAETSQV